MSVKKDDNKKSKKEEFLYHNTEMLLKNYRDVVWSIEVATIQAQISFELEMDCRLDEFLEMSYEAGADLSGTQIQEQMRTLERNKKMLKMINMALDVLQKKQNKGEDYYWILYYTYLSDKPCKSPEEILRLVEEKTEPMSWKTFYRRKREAIQTLGSILWGFTTKECLPILNDLLK